MSIFASIVAALSLCISIATAWLTLFRLGSVRMTQPTVIYFGPDHLRSKTDSPKPKVYLRTLLFSTAKRGRVVESMYVKLSRHESHQNFSVWVYGEKEKLERGSGLFVGETGICANHHFLALPDDHAFCFGAGDYRLEIFARLHGDKAPVRLFTQKLEIGQEHALALKDPAAGIYFDWGPDASRYCPHVRNQSQQEDAEDLLAQLLMKPR